MKPWNHRRPGPRSQTSIGPSGNCLVLEANCWHEGLDVLHLIILELDQTPRHLRKISLAPARMKHNALWEGASNDRCSVLLCFRDFAP